MTTDSDAPLIRRLCVSVDMERYSRWDREAQAGAQQALDRILQQLADEAELDRPAWTRQPGGDGELAVLPPGVDEGRVIAAMVRGLRAGLYRYNHDRSEDARLRVRVAMHAGLTLSAALGFAGKAPVTVVRLRDAEAVRRQLQQHQDADAVVVLSAQLYDDYIGHDDPDFNTAAFRRVRVEVPDKDFVADAWVHVPPGGRHRAAPPVDPPAAPQAGGAAADHRSGGVYITGGQVEAGTVVGRDLHGHADTGRN